MNMTAPDLDTCKEKSFPVAQGFPLKLPATDAKMKDSFCLWSRHNWLGMNIQGESRVIESTQLPIKRIEPSRLDLCF